MSRLILAISLCFAMSTAQARECTPTEAGAAEEATSKMSTWATVYAAFGQYSHCEDGAIAEGFIEATVNLLAGRWESISELERLMAEDLAFHQFALNHIDRSASHAQLARVVSLAKRRCPSKSKVLCEEVLASASRN